MIKVRSLKTRGWATFEAEKGVIHVAPNFGGELAPGHQLTEECECQPTVEVLLNGNRIVIHHGDH